MRLGYILKLKYLLYILLVCIFPLAANAKESVCNDQSIASYAFANVSPLAIYKDQKLTGSSYIEIEFGQPVSVIKKNAGIVQICLGNKVYWVKASYLTLIEERRWLLLNPNKAKVRPKVSLWRSRERLAAYLTGNAVRNAPVDYIESISNVNSSKVIQIPVFKKDYMEMRIGSRQVGVAGLLIPFPMTALKKFKEIKGKIASEKKSVTIKDTKNRVLFEVDDFIDVKKFFLERGFMPTLPANLKEDDLATPPAYVNKGSSWFSIHLWTIINKDYLRETTHFSSEENSKTYLFSQESISDKADIKLVEEILDAAIVNLRTAVHQKSKIFSIKNTIDEYREMGLTDSDATETIVQFEEAILAAESMYEDNLIQYAKNIEKLQMINISVSINLADHIKTHKSYSKFIHNHVFLGVVNNVKMNNDIEKLILNKKLLNP